MQDKQDENKFKTKWAHESKEEVKLSEESRADSRDSLWSVNETHMFVLFAYFLRFPIPSGAAILVFYASKLNGCDTGAQIAASPQNRADSLSVWGGVTPDRLVASRKYHRERIRIVMDHCATRRAAV